MLLLDDLDPPAATALAFCADRGNGVPGAWRQYNRPVYYSGQAVPPGACFQAGSGELKCA